MGQFIAEGGSQQFLWFVQLVAGTGQVNSCLHVCGAANVGHQVRNTLSVVRQSFTRGQLLARQQWLSKRPRFLHQSLADGPCFGHRQGL
jgi:hypothetical protein